MTLMPLLVLGFFALQLDRSNISNALTSTIVEDLKITRNDINSGNQLQSAGIVIFEIPSNILLQRVGAPIWITFQAIAWGMIALFQAFITNKGSYYATRFLLGMFEAGYIPGSMFVLAIFYKRDELAIRTAVFYVGNYFAAGTGSLIAAGILKLAGKNGLGGWQWLFISNSLHSILRCCLMVVVDGTFTVLVGFLFLFLLPHGPLKTTGLVPIKFLDAFSNNDRQILHKRVILDDPQKEVLLSNLNAKQILAALTDYRLWGHFAINVLALTPKGGLALYSPTIIKALGFNTTAANALSSVSSYGVIVLSLLLAWGSDRTKQRGLFSIIAVSYSTIFAGVQYALTGSKDKWAKYAAFTLLNSGNAISQGINDAWLSSNCRTPQHRSIGLALAVMGSNVGGLTGGQLFRTDDAPSYNRAFLSVLCLYSATLVMIALQMFTYWRSNKKIIAHEGDGTTESHLDREGNVWKYEL